MLQMCSGREVATNLAAAAELIGQAASARAAVAILPENFASMDSESRRRDLAEEPGEGPIQTFLSAQAQEKEIWVVGGTVPILREAGLAPAATTLVYDARGTMVADYDKIHLFDVAIPGSEDAYVESRHTTPGSRLVCVDSPVGRLGIAVCYDIRFPEQIRRLAADGMSVLAVPAAFTAATGQAHWEVLLRARAIENLCYVAAAAQAGCHENHRDTWGQSMLIDPWGTVIDQRATGIGIVTGDIDLISLKNTRDRFPALSHRRIE